MSAYLRRFDPAMSLRQIAYVQACRVGLSSEDAEDCASELFIKLWNSTDPRSSAWWTTCARNHALNYSRAKFRRHEAILNNDILLLPSVSSPLYDNLCRQELRQIIDATFPSTQQNSRNLLFSYYLYESTLAEIAEVSTASEATLRKNVARTRMRIRTVLLAQGWSLSSLLAILD